MAQWSHGDRTLYAKLVYYGPAFGGKTTNLLSLHRITDPEGNQKLLTLPTVNDRTLFFDLFPFELGDILGYQVAVKVYTVPGQVRYDTTRQVVLAGADAIVFVADSSSDRKDQNVWSLQNLRMNMRAKNLDPGKTPVLYQLNKQDLPCAAPIREVARWLGISDKDGIPAVAVEGRGVMETFVAACKRMLERLISTADDRTRRQIDASQLSKQIDQAFAPHLARLQHDAPITPSALEPEPPSVGPPVVLEGDALLERSVETSVRLGEKLITETSRVARLERETEAFRNLSESLRMVGASFDPSRIIHGALEAIQRTLDSPVASVLKETAPGQVEIVAVGGLPTDPLAAQEAAHQVLQQLIVAPEAQIVGDLSGICSDSTELDRYPAVAGAPLELDGDRGLLLAYAKQPDGKFEKVDLQFLDAVAGHLTAGLEKSRMHQELAEHRDRLELTVASRTEQLREAYESLRQMEAMKDRFLGNLSHEMKSPLTAILSAAHVIRDYKSNAKERRELTGAIVASAETLERQLDDLFRLVNLQRADGPMRPAEVAPEKLIQRAIQLSGRSGIQYKLGELAGPAVFDSDSMARALANLIDNAVKFSPPTSMVKLVLAADEIASDDGPVGAMSFSVVDRGPGVPTEDRERIFQPFEQGGDSLTSKPHGVGLGLHEAKIVVERHGGVIECIPRKGGGCEFRLKIPLQPNFGRDPQAPLETSAEVLSD